MVFALAKAMLIIGTIKGIFRGTTRLIRSAGRLTKRSVILGFRATKLGFKAVKRSYRFVSDKAQDVKEYVGDRNEDNEEDGKATEEQRSGVGLGTNTVNNIQEIVEEIRETSDVNLSQPIDEGDSYVMENKEVSSELDNLFNQEDLDASLEDLLSARKPNLDDTPSEEEPMPEDSTSDNTEDDEPTVIIGKIYYNEKPKERPESERPDNLLECDSIIMDGVSYENNGAGLFGYPKDDSILNELSEKAGQHDIRPTHMFKEDNDDADYDLAFEGLSDKDILGHVGRHYR